jgi:beta-lactamase regulating signal transducer with metallopeptidase domain
VTTALLTVTLITGLVAGLAVLGAAIAGDRRSGVRHVIWTSALVASIAALIASFAGPHVIIQVPEWSRPLPQVRVGANSEPRAPLIDLNTVIGLLWAAGVTVSLARLLGDYVSVRRLRQRAARLTDTGWLDALARARAAVGCIRPVTLRESAEIDVPLITGLRHPTLIVPSAREGWSTTERHSVLAHEVAHLVNQDLWTRAIELLACALHWFNPLVWWLAARSRDEAEFEADALVLRSGLRPSSYAAALAALAERAWYRAPGWAVGFVRRASLSRRVHRVLARAARPSPVRNPARLFVFAATCAIAAWMGFIRLEGRLAAQAPVQSVPSSADWTEDAVRELTRVLDDPSPQVRDAARRALTQLSTKAPR